MSDLALTKYIKCTRFGNVSIVLNVRLVTVAVVRSSYNFTKCVTLKTFNVSTSRSCVFLCAKYRL